MNAILPGNLKEENKNKSHYNLEKTLCTMNLILDKAPYACCAFDQNLMVQYWSPKLQALTGIKAELAIGTAVEALLPVLANDINRLRECLQGKSSIIKNLIYHPTSSATQCNLELHYVPFATLENCPAQGLIHFQDVTAEYEIRNKLIESEERFKKMADAAPVLLWLTREDGYCTYVNQSWMDFTGKTLEEEIGFGWAEGIHPDDKEKCIQNIFKCIQNKKPFEIEYRLRNRNGEYRWVMAKGIPHLNKDNQYSGFTGSVTDITEHKILIQELQNAKAAADAASVIKTQFLANVSHEIRTPLGIILGFADVIRNEKLPEDEKNSLLDRILKSGHQLLHIVDDVLDVSKVEANKFEIELIDFSLKEFINEISELFELRAQEKGLVFKTTMAENLPEFVKTDPTRIRQILTNIIGNSIKFTEAGKVELNIRCYTLDDKPCLEFKVTDTGEGIEPSSCNRIFKPFSQVDSSTTRKFGGTGLGLHLSRKLSWILGGDLKLVKSELHKGSTFLFHVPVEVVEKKRVATNFPTQHEIKQQFNDLKGARILIVDDAEENRILLGKYLKPYEVQLDFAQNGAEAVEMTHKKKFDLVLMDIQMPVLDGYGALKKMREVDLNLPVIALTAHALKTERDHCLKVGFSEHISKPVSKQKLVSYISQIISQKKTNIMSKT